MLLPVAFGFESDLAQSAVRAFPPPLRGRDRERGGSELRARRKSRKNKVRGYLASYEATAKEQQVKLCARHTPLPVPSPQGGRERLSDARSEPNEFRGPQAGL